jgi:amino-acid N-acetyltransferase
MHARIERVEPGDTPAILRLLSDNGLPTEGLLGHLTTALVVRLDDQVVACAALEVYADGALLRSVAVQEALRGSGLGHQIVRAALDLARQRGTTSVYLLTTTAEGFFPRFGFRQIVRAEVPADVRRSEEFQSACPASAVVMATDLTTPRST